MTLLNLSERDIGIMNDEATKYDSVASFIKFISAIIRYFLAIICFFKKNHKVEDWEEGQEEKGQDSLRLLARTTLIIAGYTFLFIFFAATMTGSLFLSTKTPSAFNFGGIVFGIFLLYLVIICFLRPQNLKSNAKTIIIAEIAATILFLGSWLSAP